MTVNHSHVPAQFRVLGPVRVSIDGDELSLGPRKQQVVLAALLCRPNRLVSIDMLTEAVWGDEPPRSAGKNLQAYVCNLRGQLRRADLGDRIVHRDCGYLLRVHPEELDASSFELAVRAAGERGLVDGDPAGLDLLSAALEYWRGPAFEGMRSLPIISTEAARLDRRRITVFENWAEAALARGAAAGPILDQIEIFAGQDPYRERLHMIQMAALDRQGRQTEALAVFGEYRQRVAREFGLQPSAAMQRLHEALLAAPAPALRVSAAQPCGLPRPAPGFTGRDEELARLRRLRDEGESLVVLSGPVGVGKTALALKAAYDLCDRYPDGQFFVSGRQADGRAKSAVAALREVLRDAGVFVSGENVTDLHAGWRSWVARRRVLVLLDDTPDETLIRLLAPSTGGSTLLVTARSRLSGLAEASRLTLTPLSDVEGLALLTRQLGEDRVRRDRAAALRIVRATGGMPLGIVTVGSKLAGLRHLPLWEFADRLTGPAALDELAVGSFTLRQRLAAALAELADPARTALIRLGVLTGPFTLAQAAATLGTEPRAANALLEQLIEQHLLAAPEVEVSAHEVLYQLPEPLSRFVAELAAGPSAGRGRGVDQAELVDLVAAAAVETTDLPA